MIDSSAVYAVIFFRSFVFLRINFSRLPFSRRVRSFPCATSRRGVDAASFEAKVNSAMFSADKVSRCAILSNAFMRVWPSGKAKASQAFIRGFESRYPLHRTFRMPSFGRHSSFLRMAPYAKTMEGSARSWDSLGTDSTRCSRNAAPTIRHFGPARGRNES